ncbi:MAG: translation initiation factor IF-2 [Nitrospinae bacterium]|nr:translation initiation factor IF-2 [Nitrospinota bacterium]
MGKIRINKLALELNVQNDQIIEELQKKGIVVKNYMSSIEEETANYIREIFAKEDPSSKKKKTAGKGPAKTEEAEKKAKSKPAAKPAVAKTAAVGKGKKAPKVEPEPKEQKEEGPAAVKAAIAEKEVSPPPSRLAKTAKGSGAKEKPPEISLEEMEKEELAKAKKAGKVLKAKRPPFGKKQLGKDLLTVEELETGPELEEEPKAEKKHPLKIIKQEEKPKEIKAKAPEPKPAPERVKPKPEEKAVPVAVKREEAAAPAPAEEETFEKIQLSENISIRELGEKLKCSPNEVIKQLMSFGILATINQSLDLATATKVADKMGFEVEIVSPESDVALGEEELDLPEDRKHRPPIVTIMGHVDHGKTSLLDSIRETSVAQFEKGGITQHIGAYQAKIKNSQITFLDTPGHEAFTAMRARGAQVTDIVVLVVAADDGIKPQTSEAIDHANAANVPIVVAINKIDKPDAKPDDVKKQLADKGLLPEDWGGQTIFSEVSALKKTGIDTLLEMILLQAEVMELKANPKLLGRGVVIESKLDKGRGPVATVIVQNGVLRVGDPFLVGSYFGKVRALINDRGDKIQSAPPSAPVEVVGLPDVPQPGDQFHVVRDERKARQLSASRLQKQRESALAQSSRITMEDLGRQIAEGKIKELNLIIKADVQGSIQAVQEAFNKLETKEVRIKIIHGAVGGITETDVLLASASNAIIIGFNVRPTEKASHLAVRDNVDIRHYNIIYDAINDMKKAMQGMLEPKFKEKVVGRAEVREIFSIPKIGVIAGCSVISGKVERNLNARLIRDSVVVYQGKINSLRRFKEDVKEVQSGYECGLSFDKYQDLKQGDIVEPYVLEEITT